MNYGNKIATKKKILTDLNMYIVKQESQHWFIMARVQWFLFNIPIHFVFYMNQFWLNQNLQRMVMVHYSFNANSGNSINVRCCECATVFFFLTVYRSTYLLLSTKKISECFLIYIINATRYGHNTVCNAKYYVKANSKFFFFCWIDDMKKFIITKLMMVVFLPC